MFPKFHAMSTALKDKQQLRSQLQVQGRVFMLVAGMINTWGRLGGVQYDVGGQNDGIVSLSISFCISRQVGTGCG